MIISKSRGRKSRLFHSVPCQNPKVGHELLLFISKSSLLIKLLHVIPCEKLNMALENPMLIDGVFHFNLHIYFGDLHAHFIHFPIPSFDARRKPVGQALRRHHTGHIIARHQHSKPCDGTDSSWEKMRHTPSQRKWEFCYY